VIDDLSTAVAVRSATRDDLPALMAIYNHYVTDTAITFDVVPATVEQRAEWFGHYGTSGRHRLLVATAGDAVLGYATSSTFRVKPAYLPSVEVSVYCAPDATGRGVGSRLYRELFAVLAGEDVHRAFAGIALPNEASERLHRRFGFEPVGVFHEVGRKFDRYWDVLWLERPCGPPDA
jgi:phosphinothricin acetyltransferase